MSMFLTVLLKMLMNIIMMTHKNGIGYKLKSVIVMQISLKKHGLQIIRYYVDGIFKWKLDITNLGSHVMNAKYSFLFWSVWYAKC